MSLVIVILTRNEEIHIERCIRSLQPLAAKIFIVDSFSTDLTVQLAESLGAVVVQRRWKNYADQFQWALDNYAAHCGALADWVMRLDADEVVETDLVEEILRELPRLPDDVVGVNLDRKHIFMGRWVKHGGRHPLRLLRIWRHGHGRIEDRWMDEHMVVWGGRTVAFKGGFADHNLNDLSFFTDKHNKYATREAIDILNQRLCLFPRDEALTSESASLQASFKRWAKERVYNRLPFTSSSTLYFLWRYFLQLGFLDGRSGLIYHFLQGWWYRFLVGAKLMELERAIVHLNDKDEILVELSRLTGHDLVAAARDKERQ